MKYRRAITGAVAAAALALTGLGALQASADSPETDGLYACSFTNGAFSCAPTTVATPTVTVTATPTDTPSTSPSPSSSPTPSPSSSPSSSPTQTGGRVLIGESYGGSVSGSTSAFPNQTIGRYFFSGSPATFAGSSLSATKPGETLIISFKTAPTDAAFKSLLADWNSQGRTVYFCWQHEPENNGIPAATYQATWQRLVDDERAVALPHIRSAAILMAQDLSDGSADTWYVPSTDALGFDDYALARESESGAYAAAHGKPLLFPEVGDGVVSGTTDAQSLAYAQSFFTHLPSNTVGAAWYNAGNNDLSTRPKTLAYLRTLP